MGALDITHYSTWTTKIHGQQFVSHDLPVYFFALSKPMDFVVRVLAGFQLASLNRVERANE